MSRFVTSLRSPFTSSTRSNTTVDSTASATDSCRSRHHSPHESSTPLYLSPQRQRTMLHQIKATVDDVVRSMVRDLQSRVQWQPKGVKKDIAYVVATKVHPDQTRFCCKTETSATTEDVVNMFLLTDTQTLLKNKRTIYDNVLNARVLTVLEKPTREQPYNSVYVRYSSYAAPKPLGNRDVCLLVSTNVVKQDDGSTIGYCLWDSVDLPECPDYQKSRGLVRSRMFRSGFFCRTTTMSRGDMATKVVYLVCMEMGDTTTSKFAAWLLMERFGKNLARLCNYFRRKHLNPATFRPRVEWASTRDAVECYGCLKSLHSSFTTRHHCVACGQVFCKACYTRDQVDLPGVGITSMRFCLLCLGARGLDPPKQDDRGVFSRAALAVLHRSQSCGSYQRCAGSAVPRRHAK